MARTEKYIVQDLPSKRIAMNRLAILNGPHEITIKAIKQTRSLSQNRFYWGVVVALFANWLREEWGESGITDEQAHEMLKRKILGAREMIDKDGEILELPASTRVLDTQEFIDYIEGCAKWLGEFCGIVIPEPDRFYQREAKAPSIKKQLKQSIKIVRERKKA